MPADPVQLRLAVLNALRELNKKEPRSVGDVRAVLVNLTPSSHTEAIMTASLLDVLGAFTVDTLLELAQEAEAVADAPARKKGGRRG